MATEYEGEMTIGSTGLKESGGYIHEEFLPKLRGRNGVRMYQEMAENNAIVGAILFIIDSLVRQVEWRVETPAGEEENEAAIKEKEFIEEALRDMSHTFEDFISEVLSMLVYGWSYFEVTYKIRRGPDQADSKFKSKYTDGRFGWRKIEIRSQDSLLRWLFDEDGGLDGMEQLNSYGSGASKGAVVIPIEKALLFRTRLVKGNPESKSLLRPAVRSWFFQKRIEEVEAIGIDRDLAGMPLMEVPREILNPNAGPTDKKIRSQLETMVQQIRVDERWGGLIPTELDTEGKPTGYKFRLQTTGGKRMIDTNTIVKRHESRIAMVFLAEFIMIGMDRVGAQSSDVSKKDMFKLGIETILGTIASVFNQYAIGRLEKLNGVGAELWPVLKPGKLSAPELDKLAALIKEMAGSGLLSPNPALEKELLALAKLPQPPEEETDLFDDPATPTPRESADQAAGVISQSQIDAVMRINAGIKSGELSRPVAQALAAQTLGMDEANVARFLIEESEPEPEPAPEPPTPELEPPNLDPEE